MAKQEIIGTAYIHRNGKILLAKRAATKRFLPGVFEAPGGHVEFGENPVQTIIRELQEELGVRVKVGEPFHVFDYMDGDSHVIEVCLLCELGEGEIFKLIPEEFSEVRWFAEAEASGLRNPTTHSTPHSQPPSGD